MKKIRQAAVAGAFYPGQKQILQHDVNALLRTALLDNEQPKYTPQSPPKAMIVPHAGYIYSGKTAAAAYIRLSPFRESIKRVILLGPVHRVPVRGLALPDADLFTTPLGDIEVDQSAVEAIKNKPQVLLSAAAHALEHSLEVQLPFLQTVLADFKLVPLAVGDATAEEVADVLNTLWGGEETLIVISSDLSHFLPYQTAQLVDSETIHSIMNLSSTLNHQQACGGIPVNGLLLAARAHHLKPQLLDLRNSGDTAGDKDRVVGYASIAFVDNADAGRVHHDG
ncbi:MAG: AmmeMemoRadiSam system protein B [Gammaproteobacteria bacterium]|nr:AmmeMemoRadiSam system protein B [Gammaproteobacteria bacterium]